MKLLLLLIAIGFVTFNSVTFAQVPTDNCAGAPALTLSTSCTNVAFSNTEDGQPEAGAIAPPCLGGGTASADVWFTVVGNGNTITVTLSNPSRICRMAVYTDCTQATSLGCSQMLSGATGTVTFNSTNGVTYYIQIMRAGGNATADLTGNICATYTNGPANDDCGGAINVPVNPGLACATTVPGTVLNATASSQTNGCFGTADDDVWYSFVATNTTHYISLTGVAGSTTDLYHSVYAGTCGAPGAALVCSDPNTSTVTGLTPGNTYFIRVYSWTSTPGQTTTFNVCVTSPPPPPANDNCTGAVNVPVNPGLTCATTVSGTISSATASAQANGCGGTADDDVWYSFVATNTTHYISLTSVAGSTTDLYHSVYAGSCAAPGAALVCSDPNNSTVTGLTPGNTYYVRVYSWTSTAGQTSTFNICVTTPPPPPANDNCGGAINVPVNTGIICTTSVPGTIASATASAQANGCFGTADDDVWYSFVATNTTHYISLNNVAGSTTDLYHSVYAGSCAAPGAALVCSDPNSSTVTGLTPGNTYYVRVYSWTSTAGQNSTFNVCIGTPPPPPANDNCGGAINVPVSTTTCSSVTGTIASATASAQATGCGGTADDDVWYSFVATSPAVTLSLSNISGSTTDLYHSVYSGTCGTIGAPLVCSDPNSSTVTGLTIGNTYYVRIYSWTSAAGQTSVFDLCIMAAGACGTPNNQDYCVAPAILTPGGGNFSANTSGTYTQDQPANLSSIFCGSIENNSWYEFTATATTATFNFTSVSGPGCTYGVQAQVYAVTEDMNGCCANFASSSNCWNPGTTTTGTVNATGLTIGQTYRLMVDGNAGSVCDFTVANWSATGIIALGVNYTDFSGLMLAEGNRIQWETATEKNNDYFILERSFDGETFESVAKIEGHGTKYSPSTYAYLDGYRLSGIVYYRLKQVDMDGDVNYSDVLTLNRLSSNLIEIFPNPANESIMVQLAEEGASEIRILSMNGNPIQNKQIESSNQLVVMFDLSDLANGMYLIQVVSPSGEITTKQFIKK